jgi:cytochrome d ubiquinol oxidase subunit II
LYTFISLPHLTAKFRANPVFFVFPVAALICIANIILFEWKTNYAWAFIMSSLTILLLMLTAAVAVFPNVLISSANPGNSLSIYDVASSDKALKTMLVIVDRFL